MGLKIYYKNFPEINLALPMLPVLAFVLPTQVKASSEPVIKVVKDVIERKHFQESVVRKWMNLEYFPKKYLHRRPYCK